MKKKKKILNFDEPEENLGYLLWQVSTRWQTAMNESLGEMGMNQTQFVIMAALHWLELNSDSVTQNDIANHARIDKTITSKILKSLQNQGFVIRQEHAIDTRAKEVALTKSGLKLLEKANKIVENVDNQYFTKVKKDKLVLKNLLQTLIQ
jgi:DNA-binding MarR family transcriptional regulator